MRLRRLFARAYDARRNVSVRINDLALEREGELDEIDAEPRSRQELDEEEEELERLKKRWHLDLSYSAFMRCLKEPAHPKGGPECDMCSK